MKKKIWKTNPIGSNILGSEVIAHLIYAGAPALLVRGHITGLYTLRVVDTVTGYLHLCHLFSATPKEMKTIW